MEENELHYEKQANDNVLSQGFGNCGNDSGKLLDQELLTGKQCQNILTKYCEEKKFRRMIMKEHHIEPATEAIGFLGTYHRLTLTAVDIQGHSNSVGNLKNFAVPDRKLMFFVKSVPVYSEEKEKDAIFTKEAKLYESLFEELRKFSVRPWCPRPYLVQNNLIVMEDLLNTGYNQLPASGTHLNAEQMRSVLKAVASMHASSISYELKFGKSIGSEFAEILQEITVAPDIRWFSTGLKALNALINQLPEFKSFVLQNNLEKSLDSIYQMVNPSKKYKNVLCHRDLWRGNIFFGQPKDQNEPIAIFVDFQTCRYSPPCVDLIFVLWMNLNSAERYARQNEYLTFYYEQLKQDLKIFDVEVNDYISSKQLWDSINEYQIFGAVYKAVAATILNVPKRLVTNEYKYINRTQIILSLMYTDAAFCASMEENIFELFKVLQTTSDKMSS